VTYFKEWCSQGQNFKARNFCPWGTWRPRGTSRPRPVLKDFSTAYFKGVWDLWQGRKSPIFCVPYSIKFCR